MSFQDKSFWIEKSTDGDPAFDSPSGIEPKRSHQWFLDAEEHELFPNKKQALENLNSTSSSEIAHANVPSWDSTSGFPSVPNQFMHQLFGSETTSPVSFSERNLCPAGTDNSDASVSLSMSHAMEDSEGCFSYGAFRKVKVNEVKDSDNTVHAPKGYSYTTESSNDISPGQAFTRESESSFTSIGQAYDKEDDSVTLMGQCYNRGDDHIGSASPSYGKGDGHPFSMGETYTKDCTNMIYFGGFHEAQDIIPGRPTGSSDLYIPSAIQTPEAFNGKELEASSVSAAVRNIPASKSKPECAPKNKPEFKSGRKEAPNSFPSNVRSLISTGMLDGVPVKYVSLSLEELRGIIKGSGYLCGCQSCNYTKVLNAYEFERHAGCKTKHPNNHIYFENGKTIYQIVQELRSTPESMLFDVIQTVFGAPINQKSFRIWKESFQAATRELQRIYGKEELNM